LAEGSRSAISEKPELTHIALAPFLGAERAAREVEAMAGDTGDM